MHPSHIEWVCTASQRNGRLSMKYLEPDTYKEMPGNLLKPKGRNPFYQRIYKALEDNLKQAGLN